MTITTSTVENSTYYHFENRNTDYSLRLDPWKRWELSSSRRGCASFGSCRHFDTLEDVEAVAKGFKGLASIINH